MEVKGNLMKDERMKSLGYFNFPNFKKVAQVIVGEPTLEFKKKTQEQVLMQKQEASDAEFKVKKAEEQRKRLMAKRQKDLEKAKKKVEKEKKKKVA